MKIYQTKPKKEKNHLYSKSLALLPKKCKLCEGFFWMERVWIVQRYTVLVESDGWWHKFFFCTNCINESTAVYLSATRRTWTENLRQVIQESKNIDL